jgi:hypothetical protein
MKVIMKILLITTLLFTILYLNYYFPIQLIYYFGVIGTMILDSVVVFIVALLVVSELNNLPVNGQK